jgi:hypothetical protein
MAGLFVKLAGPQEELIKKDGCLTIIKQWGSKIMMKLLKLGLKLPIIKSIIIGKAEKEILTQINSSIPEGIGKITALSIDKPNKSATATLRLKGESKSIKIVVNKYTIKGGNLVIKELTTDRPWLNTIVNMYAIDKSFSLPDPELARLFL